MAERRPRQLVTKTITVPGNLRIACDQFNSGQYFECHETLEEIWQEEQGDVRDLYKGLIQVAAAFVHVGRNNHFGANRLLSTAIGYLQPYRTEVAMGFDVEAIATDAERARDEVSRLGPGHVVELPASFIPVYSLDESALTRAAVRWAAWGFDSSGAPLPMEITVVD